MDNESQEPMDRAIKALLYISPVMHRKIIRVVFAKGKDKSGTTLAYHHLVIMKVLHDFGTLSSSEIGAMIFVSKAQMTHSTGKLMDMGLIEKQQDTVDHRKVNIRLTGKGQTTIQRIDDIMLDLLRKRLSSLSDDDLEELAESVDRTARVMLKLK